MTASKKRWQHSSDDRSRDFYRIRRTVIRQHAAPVTGRRAHVATWPLRRPVWKLRRGTSRTSRAEPSCRPPRPSSWAAPAFVHSFGMEMPPLRWWEQRRHYPRCPLAILHGAATDPAADHCRIRRSGPFAPPSPRPLPLLHLQPPRPRARCSVPRVRSGESRDRCVDASRCRTRDRYRPARMDRARRHPGRSPGHRCSAPPCLAKPPPRTRLSNRRLPQLRLRPPRPRPHRSLPRMRLRSKSPVVWVARETAHCEQGPFQLCIRIAGDRGSRKAEDWRKGLAAWLASSSIAASGSLRGAAGPPTRTTFCFCPPRHWPSAASDGASARTAGIAAGE